MRKLTVVLGILWVMSGCILLEKSINVTFCKTSPDMFKGTYAILPFQDQRESRSGDLGFNAGDAMTDAFETEFVGAGYKVVDRRNIQNALDEMKFSYQGDVDPEQRKQIGKLTNSDIMVIGKIRTFQKAVFGDRSKPDKPTSCASISFSVKAVQIETGEILWTGSFTRSTGFKDDFMFGCDCNLLKYANKAAGDFIKKIAEGTKQKEKP